MKQTAQNRDIMKIITIKAATTTTTTKAKPQKEMKINCNVFVYDQQIFDLHFSFILFDCDCMHTRTHVAHRCVCAQLLVGLPMLHVHMVTIHIQIEVNDDGDNVERNNSEQKWKKSCGSRSSREQINARDGPTMSTEACTQSYRSLTEILCAQVRKALAKLLYISFFMLFKC